MDILAVVSGSHALPQVKAYCMYMHFYLGLSKARLAEQFHKSASCIGEWVAAYERGEDLSRKQKANMRRKFGVGRRKWLVDLYKARPVLLLEEAKKLFQARFSTISASHISFILREAGLSWKVIECHAIQINQEDVIQFAKELAIMPFLLENLVFLDEVSFDNRAMLQTKGWGVQGEKLFFRGEFTRKPRVSLLCWIGVNGLLEASMTEGTFDCAKFSYHYKEFCTSPFFNPIEIVFGLMKKLLQRHYVENSKWDLAMVAWEVLQLYVNRSFHKIFASCRFTVSGFDPSVAFNVPLVEFGFDEAENSE
ncbi:Serine kinase [Chytriomyces hyalinus]|nr:Serine kinase [Chytriomyces hyalinus]